MAYDYSQDYDLSDQLDGLSPLAAAGIDPQRALMDRKGVEQELANRSLGLPGSGKVVPRVVPSTVSNDAGQTESGTAGDISTMRDRLNSSYDQQKELTAQKEEQSVPTNPQDPQYRPSLKRKILRGLAGAGLGFAEHGLVGAGVGAVAPEMVGAPGYSDPTAEFGRTEAARQRNLAVTSGKLDDAASQGKTALDYGKELTTAGNTLAERQNQTQQQSSIAQRNSAMANKYQNAVDPATIQQGDDGKWYGMTYGGQKVETGAPKGFKADPIDQRTKDADRLGLKGDERKFYITNGKLREPGVTVNTGRDEAKTVTVGDKVMQFNPKTGRYDIEVGPAKTTTPTRYKDRQMFETHWDNEFRKARAPFDAKRKEILKQYGIDKDPKAWDDESTAAVKENEANWAQKAAQMQQEKDAEAEQYGVYNQPAARTVVPPAAARAPQAAATPKPGTKLDAGNPQHVALAKSYLEKAGGDKNKARQLAKADGYNF